MRKKLGSVKPCGNSDPTVANRVVMRAHVVRDPSRSMMIQVAVSVATKIRSKPSR